MILSSPRRTNITLSILIPSFDYIDGFERILELIPLYENDLEVIIYDDSPTQAIHTLYDSYMMSSSPKSHKTHFIYRHNISVLGSALGAVENWNALLNSSSGKYVHLIHHDEFPISKDFYVILLDHLRYNKICAIYILDLLVVNQHFRNFIYKLAPLSVRFWLCKQFPSFLFIKNFIGPTAALVFAREISPTFNCNLKWLVDVEFYYKLFFCSHAKTIKLPLSVGSYHRSSGSITSSLGDSVKLIENNELAYVNSRYLKSSAFIIPVANVFAICVWWVFRGIGAVSCLIYRKKLLANVFIRRNSDPID